MIIPVIIILQIETEVDCYNDQYYRIKHNSRKGFCLVTLN